MRILKLLTIWIIFLVVTIPAGFCQTNEDTTKSATDIKVIEERLKNYKEMTYEKE